MNVNKSVYPVMDCYDGNDSITANDRTTKVANDHPLPSTRTAVRTNTGSSHFERDVRGDSNYRRIEEKIKLQDDVDNQQC